MENPPEKAQSLWTARHFPDVPETSYWVKIIHEGRAVRSQAAGPARFPWSALAPRARVMYFRCQC